ncbi:ATP-binding protein [Mycolicibacterium hodleri]|uniref:histidine kinase n=1 Tax=Mycolicibacterium hodleri TaxID=49897 RepID=A0A502E4T0_9MYCO|nr:ATP-binding protein [Mycolicibacterium hodleri]TPG32738.1 GAF domain-containing protein [Mycolicibacterium hodleri]
MTEPNDRTSRTSRQSFRLHQELKDARNQSAASREILAALGRDAANTEAVLDAVVENAARLCGARAAQLFLAAGDLFVVSTVSGETPDQYYQYLLENPIARDRSSAVGRAAEDKRTVQIADVLSDASYGRTDLQKLTDFRTLLSTPMLLEGEVVGVLSMWRTRVAPFSDAEREHLEEFAAQGALALRQANLMRELKSRETLLSSKVEQLEALREVGEAVGSSLDLDVVLDQIVSNAVRLTNRGFGDITLRPDGGSILEYEASSSSFHVHAVGCSRGLLDQLRTITIHRDSTLVGRTALERRSLEVSDLARVERDALLEVLFRDGWHSVLAVPMLRGEKIVGVLVIRRRGTGVFPPDVITLLETFASQSALAIVNARLFGELEVASRHKSEFLASMSHELRTPLNAVNGFSEVLLNRSFGEINERQAEYLRDIWNSGKHLVELVNDILDLSKVEDGHMVLEPSTFLVSSAIEAALAMVRGRAAQHAIDVAFEIADEVDLIDADERRFKQVLLNLASNAVKFTPDGGRVRIDARAEGTELVVTVTDTGPGVAPADEDRIFDSFQQGCRGAAKEEGTGLGLTLSRQMVELFGGRLWLDSTLGRGSTFGFSVPGLREHRREDAAPKLGGLPVIVLLDEDRASQDLVEAYLDGFEAEVLRAWDGEKALELVRTVQPAAVVLEVGLPRLDGWQVIAQLKADPDTVGIPVIVASTVDDRPRGLALGASAYLLKPIRRDQLVDALHRVGALPEAPAS